MLNNKIILPGVNNTRDLGGYPAGGKRVRKGVLIRSGTLNRAGPETVFLLSYRYRVRHIVDLRMGSVIAGAPDPDVPGADYHKLPVVEMEDYIAASGDTGEAEKFLSGGIDRQALFDMAYERGLLSPEMYVLFLLGERGKNAYRKFFNILLTNDPDKGAVLWHCEDGKDRAGLAAMLLLSALGTDMDTIMEDYLLTNENNSAKLDKIRKDCEAFGMPQEKIEALLFVSGGVFAEYLTYAVHTLEKKYGSVTGYLTQELGFVDGDVDILRMKYTE